MSKGKKQATRGSDGAELVDSSAKPKATSEWGDTELAPQKQSIWDADAMARKASSFRPHSEWDGTTGQSESRQSAWESGEGKMSEWDVGAARKASSFRAKSEWDPAALPPKSRSFVGDSFILVAPHEICCSPFS